MDKSIDTDQLDITEDISSTESSRLPQKVEDIRPPKVVDSTESEISSLDPDSDWILEGQNDSQMIEAVNTHKDTSHKEVDESKTELSEESTPIEEPVQRRTSKRSNFGAPPQRYGNIITHKIASIMSSKLKNSTEATELYIFQY